MNKVYFISLLLLSCCKSNADTQPLNVFREYQGFYRKKCVDAGGTKFKIRYSEHSGHNNYSYECEWENGR